MIPIGSHRRVYAAGDNNRAWILPSRSLFVVGMDRQGHQVWRKR